MEGLNVSYIPTQRIGLSFVSPMFPHCNNFQRRKFSKAREGKASQCLNVWEPMSLQPPPLYYKSHLQSQPCSSSQFFPGMAQSTTGDIIITTNDRNWLKSTKKYFCFAIPTSHPLLTAVKLTAHAT